MNQEKSTLPEKSPELVEAIARYVLAKGAHEIVKIRAKDCVKASGVVMPKRESKMPKKEREAIWLKVIRIEDEAGLNESGSRLVAAEFELIDAAVDWIERTDFPEEFAGISGMAKHRQRLYGNPVLSQRLFDALMIQ